jgi:hypothetical protein
MNGYTQYPNHSDRKGQALPTAAKSPAQGAKLGAALKGLGQAVASFLTSGNDLKISTRQHNGQLVWYVYDPMTEQRQQFSAEADLRAWLETRYYQN